MAGVKLERYGRSGQDITPVLLLFLLGFVLLMASLLVFLIHSGYGRSRPMADEVDHRDSQTNPVMSRPASFCPSLLKRSNCWLAVKGQSLAQVQKALALHDPQPCSWAEGVSVRAGQKLFVSPPVAGWVLVIGPALPEPGEDVDACYRFLMDLSRKLGHIQYFNANPLVGHHAWVRLDFGHVVRAYAWAGETLWNEGPLTRAEADLRLRCHDYGESPGPASYGAGGNGRAQHRPGASPRRALEPRSRGD